MKKILNQKKGVAGLNIYLSIIAMIFVIGIMIMAFALVGSQLKNATTDNTSLKVINDTTTSLSGATNWFPIFIVMGAIVVIILLLVITVVSLRGGGLMGGGEMGG